MHILKQMRCHCRMTGTQNAPLHCGSERWPCRSSGPTRYQRRDRGHTCATWRSHSRRSRKCSATSGPRRRSWVGHPPTPISSALTALCPDLRHWSRLDTHHPGDAGNRRARRPLNTRSKTAVAAQISSGGASFGAISSAARKSAECSGSCFAGPPCSSTAATCRCIPNGATVPQRCARLPRPVFGVAINTQQSPIIHTDLKIAGGMSMADATDSGAPSRR